MDTTKKAAHTPGPWSFELKNHNRNLYGGDGKSLMCDEQYYPWVPEEDADWNLIAAAPEMLEALESLLLDAENFDLHIGKKRADMIRAAIQKARGAQ